MEFKKGNISNFEGAFRGMRNPLDSWAKSDSEFGLGNIDEVDDAEQEVTDAWIEDEGVGYEQFSEDYERAYSEFSQWLEQEGIGFNGKDCYKYSFIGPKDMDLAQRLIKSGPEHCKFLRQIQVCVDITAPLYWWKEFDTYKVGTTANSTSTMHTLCKSPITRDKFAFDKDYLQINDNITYADYVSNILDMCEELRRKYCLTGNKAYWRALVQILPEAFLQTRTVTLSYANLRNIYFQRRDHKLTEWHEFCDWIKQLPYSNELIILEDK